MPSRGARTFAALVERDGVYLVEYAEETSGLRIVEAWSEHRTFASADDAFDALRTLLDARSVRRPSVSVTVNGFGALHHSVLLPAAAPEVLEPLVRREVLRSFDVEDPVIRFTLGDVVERRATRRTADESGLTMIFIAAAPHDLAAAMRAHLGDGGIQVRCVTIVAEAIRQVYASVTDADEPTAVLVCLGSGPYLAFFLHRHPEIIIDPPVVVEAETALDPESLSEQVERGAVYFRQRFGGAEPARLLLAAPAADRDAVSEVLQQNLGIPIAPLMGDASPEQILAMGSAIAGRSAKTLDLFDRPATVSQRIGRTAAAIGAPALALCAAAVIALLWAVAQFGSLHGARAQRDGLQQRVATMLSGATSMRDAAQERATHEQQAKMLNTVYGERGRLAGTLAAIAATTNPALRFDSLGVDEGKTGWNAVLVGSVLGTPGSAAVRTLNEFYGSLQTKPGVSTPNLERFDYAKPSSDTASARTPVALTFRISFNILSPSGGDDQ